jgi:phosphatidylglycerophosphate synthase
VRKESKETFKPPDPLASLPCGLDHDVIGVPNDHSMPTRSLNMFDAAVRPWINPPLEAAGRWLSVRGLSADCVTFAGFGIGLGAAVSIALGQFGLSLGLILANRLADGLDGAIARATGPTDRGGFLDIALDFIFYALIPLAFALHNPNDNAMPAAALLASFLANGGAFFAFANAAAKRSLITSAQGLKSMYYLAGLAEGAETITVFCAFCLWPDAFELIAYGFSVVCLLSALGRLALGWRILG